MLKQSFILIFGKIVAAALGLVSGIFLARVLGPEKLGQYQIFISTQTVLITSVTLGIGNSSIYFINKNKITEKAVVSSFLKIFIVLAIVSCIGFYIIVNNETNYFGKIEKGGFILFLLGTASLIIISILRPILFVRKKVLQITWINLLPSIFLIIGVIGLLVVKKLSVFNVLSFWGIGNFIALLFSLLYHKHNISFNEKIKLKNVLDVSFYGIKLSASNLLFILISNTSIFFINKISEGGFSDVGLYSRAIAISSIVYMIPTAVGPLLFSRWSTNLNKNECKNEIQKTLRVFNTLSVVVIIIGVIFSNTILQILYGIEFISAQNTLIILLISLMFQVRSEVFNNYLASQGRAMLTMYSLLITFVFIIVGNMILIPIYGISGAAIAVLISSFINSLILNLFVNKEIKIGFINSLFINKEDLNYLVKKIKL